jgi:hypothetical protein
MDMKNYFRGSCIREGGRKKKVEKHCSKKKHRLMLLEF